jgi:nitroreductase
MIDYEKAHDRAALRAKLLGELLGDPAWQPTFVFYMGYPTLTAHASPRRPVENVVL